MPRLAIRDPFGMSYRVDTTSWELLERWLREWMPRLAITGEDPIPVMAMEVWPLDLPDRTFDWPAYAPACAEPFPLGYTAADALAALHARKTAIEQQMMREAASHD